MVMRGDGQEPVKSSGGSGRHLGGGAIAAGVGVVLLVVFIAQNSQDVKFDFLAWSITIPIWLFSILMAGVGALIVFGFGVLRRHQRRKERRS
jgi:uncharacterized integral membrane protein